MSQENVETVQRAVEAWNANALDAFLSELDPNVEWRPAIQPGLEGKAPTKKDMKRAKQLRTQGLKART